MRLTTASLLIAIAALTACTTTRTVDYRTLTGKNHASIAAMVASEPAALPQILPRPWGAATDGLDFDNRADVMRLEGGLSYVQFVQLPSDAPGRMLVLRSYPTFNRPVSIFVPNVRFYNSALELVGTETAVDFMPVASMRGDHLLGKTHVPPGAVYVLVFTDDAKIGTRHDFKARPLIGTDPADRDAGPGFASREAGMGSSYEGRVKLDLE